MKLQELLVTRISEDVTPIADLDKAISLIKDKCSDCIRLLKARKFIYRGWGGKVDVDTINLVDPITRKSIDTSNFYTLIFDNHPEMTEFPKRSKSLIASNNHISAGGYGWPTILIPFNGVKIGIVNNPDIWDVCCKIFNSNIDIKTMNLYFSYEFSDSSWTTFKSQLKNPRYKEELFNQLKNNYSIDITPDDRNLYDIVIEGYSPKVTGLTYCTTADSKLDKLARHKSEVWIGGTCLSVPREMISEIISRI